MASKKTRKRIDLTEEQKQDVRDQPPEQEAKHLDLQTESTELEERIAPILVG